MPISGAVMKRESKRTGVFTRRALIVAGVQVVALGALAAKLYQVQVVQGARYATMSDSNRISARLIAPPRGPCTSPASRFHSAGILPPRSAFVTVSGPALSPPVRARTPSRAEP